MTISRLHYIVTTPEQAEQACSAGANWIQLRLKNKRYEDWKAIALETQAVCHSHQSRLIINDNTHLAGEIGSDGLHLGKEDMPLTEARQLLGTEIIIGGTANTLEDILMHAEAGANYIGLGPFRFTKTKEKLSPILGLAGYESLMKALQQRSITIPVIAIGGITLADVPALLDTGLYGIAVSSAITQAANPAEQTRLFIQSCLSHESTPDYR
ncbi:thiamine phosphate synthase [Siphonobacter sp. SORGH_AS_0500]|uniref:thiamine phosphate synthase n=1 Tax=Siphonobacter sp. SORGH_AS_0500 TaxID=1864824 RepID=UPI002859BBA4|nr:thiamine phosphate synthase [Siphonobacter sp. SORGH_AS_0500]MDR6195751.1 thiamine-phosphate pyrophosphorylase [Siphonobacter sp. SORGH_AS_0500]